MSTQLVRKVLCWCLHYCSHVGYWCGDGAGGAALTLIAACGWAASRLAGHSYSGWSLFHRGGDTFGGAWGGAVTASVGGGTLRSTVSSSVGDAYGGVNLWY